MRYATAARAGDVRGLDLTDLDRRRAGPVVVSSRCTPEGTARRALETACRRLR